MNDHYRTVYEQIDYKQNKRFRRDFIRFFLFFRDRKQIHGNEKHDESRDLKNAYALAEPDIRRRDGHDKSAVGESVCHDERTTLDRFDSAKQVYSEHNRADRRTHESRQIDAAESGYDCRDEREERGKKLIRRAVFEKRIVVGDEDTRSFRADALNDAHYRYNRKAAANKKDAQFIPPRPLAYIRRAFFQTFPPSIRAFRERRIRLR